MPVSNEKLHGFILNQASTDIVFWMLDKGMVKLYSTQHMIPKQLSARTQVTISLIASGISLETFILGGQSRKKKWKIKLCNKYWVSFHQLFLTGFLTLPETSPSFMCLQFKSLENTVGNREIAHNKQFLRFPQCFLPI